MLLLSYLIKIRKNKVTEDKPETSTFYYSFFPEAYPVTKSCL